MKKYISLFVCLYFIPVLALADATQTDYEKNWPQWRGPYANGVSPHGNPPVKWNESKNIKWKTEIPGKGHATPIIWDDQIFVLTAIKTDKKIESQKEVSAQPAQGQSPGRTLSARTENVHKFALFAINRSDGSIKWHHTAREELPHEGAHPTGTWASNSPVTDGKRIYAYFGSRGLYCYDMQGKLMWDKDFGDMKIKMSFGEGSSPALYKDKIVVNWDHEGQSFIIAIDKNTGKEFWKVNRDETTSWATPLIIERDGKTQVITSATKLIRSYDLATGQLLWESSGMTENAIPSPVAANDMVYLMSGYKGNALQAIRLSEAKENIAGSTALVWTLDKDTPYTPSPLLYGDILYFTRGNDSRLSCFDASTGEAYYTRQKLEKLGELYSSPVGANGKVYIASRNGTTKVIKHGTQYEVLATNKLDDSFSASPVIVDNELYLRGEKNLYCIEEQF
jgi:outer membrane protein assembly factor BamB